ncbi:MAG: hypothetical protein V3T21_06745, partial [Candidatus Margulisiibacteriota bacterium]
EETATRQDETQHQTFWVEIYAESESQQHERYNPVSDLSVRVGIHTLKIGGKDLDLYLKGRIFADNDRLYWNNRYELGLGSRYRPFSDWGLILFGEVLYGGYTGRENPDEPNPDDAPYVDFQGGLAFWNWWGRQPWQTGQALEAYLPFTGWREFYGDGIYYHHANDDLIVTADYKEGLLLGKIGPVGVDVFMALEAGWDTKAYAWNSYIASGLGIRFKPFEKLDLKIGLEYLWRHFYRGGYSDINTHDSGLGFTMVLWNGW